MDSASGLSFLNDAGKNINPVAGLKLGNQLLHTQGKYAGKNINPVAGLKPPELTAHQ